MSTGVILGAFEADFQTLLHRNGVTNFGPAHDAAFRGHGCPPRELWGSWIPTLVIAEWLRKDRGCALVVSSAYRTAEHNAEVSGAERSRHVLGGAIDFYAANGEYTPVQLARRLLAHPLSPWLGIEADTRPGEAHAHLDSWGLFGGPLYRRFGYPDGWWEVPGLTVLEPAQVAP